MSRTTALFVALVLGLLASSFAHAKVFGLLELRSAVLGNDEAQWRAVAYSDIPPDASNATKDLYYEAMYFAAFKASDLGRIEELTTLWEQAKTGSIRPRSVRFQLLVRGTGAQLEDAVVLGEQQVAWADTQGPNFQILIRSDLANLYLSIGEFGKAETLLGQMETYVKGALLNIGRAGWRAFDVPNATAKYLGTRCRQNIYLYQYRKAEQFCLQAIAATSEAIGYIRMASTFSAAIVTSDQIENHTRLASIYINTGRYYDAELSMKKAEQLFSSNPVPRFAGTWISEARLELAIAKKEVAEFLKFDIALGKTFNVSEASIRYVTMRKHQQTALVTFEQWQAAQQAFDASDAIVLNSDAYMKQAARHIIPRGLTYLMNSRAALISPILNEELKKAIANLGPEHAQTGMLRGLHAIALAADATQSSLALAELDQAVTILTSSANLAGDFFNQADHPIAQRMIFEKYIELAGKSTNTAYAGRALGIADSLRGSGVQQAMNDAAVRAAASTPQLAELVRRDQDAKNELQSLYGFITNRAGELEAKRLESVVRQMKTRIAELEKTRAQLDIEITQQFAEYKKLTNPQPPSLFDIASKLKPQEALLALLPTDKQVYVWAVSADAGGKVNQQFANVDLSKPQLAALVKRLRASLEVADLPASRRPVFDHAAAQSLYQLLLAPVQSAFQGKSSLVVAAGGVLGQIPFGVLQNQIAVVTAQSDSFQNAPWLIKQAAITHVPSVAAWLSMRALPHRPAEQALMAWGDPLFNLSATDRAKTDTSLGTVRKVNLTRASTTVDLQKEAPRSALQYANILPLPETRDELSAIAKTLGADAAKDLFFGAQATRESVLAANKSGALGTRKVIAFATHGLMAGDLPNLTQPALAMTATKDADTNVLAPLLTLEDILGLKLNADWVVLSACNTAAADGKAEEALSGLARGFFYAGSRSLLVTHWAVDSDSAATLTTETFKHYQSNPLAPKAESLRQAMLGVLNNPATSHPTYWAPYALVGDGGR